jgi:glycosyltransferase involved in cell wall biosynthesis
MTYSPRIAVLIPCYNEQAAIASVVGDFQRALPHAQIYVYDNNSADATVEVAKAAGALTYREPRQGKGNVVRRMFADIEADVYVLVDGDDTYDADSARAMVDKLWRERLDMVNGRRVDNDALAYRAGHRFGNAALSNTVRLIFGQGLDDLLSGYRVFSRRYVKSFPALASGFEIETELTVHALALRMPISEVPSSYKHRPEGSQSKLRTYRDGTRILATILWLAKSERPMATFGLIFGFLALISLMLAVPVFITYAETGLVPRLPTALAATGAMVLAALSLAVGLILDAVTRARLELRRLHYLNYAAPGDHLANGTQDLGQ